MRLWAMSVLCISRKENFKLNIPTLFVFFFFLSQPIDLYLNKTSASFHVLFVIKQWLHNLETLVFVQLPNVNTKNMTLLKAKQSFIV